MGRTSTFALPAQDINGALRGKIESPFDVVPSGNSTTSSPQISLSTIFFMSAESLDLFLLSTKKLPLS